MARVHTTAQKAATKLKRAERPEATPSASKKWKKNNPAAAQKSRHARDNVKVSIHTWHIDLRPWRGRQRRILARCVIPKPPWKFYGGMWRTRLVGLYEMRMEMRGSAAAPPLSPQSAFLLGIGRTNATARPRDRRAPWKAETAKPQVRNAPYMGRWANPGFDKRPGGDRQMDVACKCPCMRRRGRNSAALAAPRPKRHVLRKFASPLGQLGCS